MTSTTMVPGEKDMLPARKTNKHSAHPMHVSTLKMGAVNVCAILDIRLYKDPYTFEGEEIADLDITF